MFIGKPEGRKPYSKPEHKLLDDIEMDLKYQESIPRPELITRNLRVTEAQHVE